jgi:hypothetical protein
MMRPASLTGMHRGRYGESRGRGWAASFMAESLRRTGPVFLQSWNLNSVASP